jgi:UDP-N-acetyl-2-amino-2-deoxyglucuronate dehydrogenase
VKWYRPPSYYQQSRWRGTQALDGGGALMNQGIHTVDLLLWLFGPVRRVTARAGALLHPIEVEDTAVALLEFVNGALGTLEAATSAYPGYSRRIELTGANGTLILDGDALAAIDLKDARDDERPSPASTATVSAASPVVADTSAHVRVFQDFLDAIAERRPPCCDGPGGRQSVALINAVYESARLDRPVALT